MVATSNAHIAGSPVVGNNRATILDAVFVAAGSVGKAENLLIIALRDAGDQEDTKYTFHAGYLSAKLAITRAEAFILLGKAGAASTTAGDDEKRTPHEEEAYTSSRQAWSRLLKAAGLKTATKQGGARDQSKKERKLLPGEAPSDAISIVNEDALHVPRFTNEQEAIAYMGLIATHLAHVQKQNAATIDKLGALGTEYRAVISDLQEVAKLTPETAEAARKPKAKAAKA